jgi:1-deoxy-D-xylulose-5-phosphate synthase
LLHDVCLQCLPVVIMVDRAGIVGEDGETHQGIYDLSLLLPLPGLAVYCPIDYANLRQVLVQALASNRPVAIRYPRGRHKPLLSADQAEAANLGIRCLKQGGQVSLIALGTLAGTALDAAGLLAGMGIDAEVLAVIGAKPIDLEALIRSARKTGRVLLMEESVLTGGFGQSVLPGLIRAVPGLRFGQLGLEDQMLCQGSREQLLRQVRLDCTAMVEAARALVEAK